SEQIRKHVRLTTQPIEEPDDPRQLNQIIEMAGAEDMIMYSSDYPHWDFDNPRVSLPPLAKTTRGKILYETAAAVYGIDVSAPIGRQAR
ncbi:MAG: amidohydrolase family protein, partial [Gemmatimonas sp.]|nr:amidohydrolase family protein [Gemmatimonas sp.]